jgi:signal recognition particle subunit SRP19
VTFRIEEHHHPAHWMRREGRIVAEWHEGKEALIKKVAQRLEVKR